MDIQDVDLAKGEDKSILLDSRGGSISIDELIIAIQRIETEKLDLNHFNAGEFVNGECWVVMDSDLCTVEINENLLNVLRNLAKKVPA